MVFTTLLRALRQPSEVGRQLVDDDSSPILELFRYPLLLVLLPPVFAFIGATARTGISSVRPAEPAVAKPRRVKMRSRPLP